LVILLPRLVVIDRGADRLHVLSRIVRQQVLQPLDQRRREVEVAAIEVLPLVERQPADRIAEHVVCEADRVRERHDHDLAADLSCGIGREQAVEQIMQDEEARDLVGVQRRLQVHLAARAGCADVVDLEATPRARTGRQQCGSFDAMGQLVVPPRAHGPSEALP
jgi:hypothetical protein